MYVRFGYVAMSVHVPNASPSKTMTVTQFKKIRDRKAAIRKLERIAEENLKNCLRLLWHNKAHDIRFFRLSSRLIPLADHELVRDWDYMLPLQESFAKLGRVIAKENMRVDFHPDHYVLFTSPRKNVFLSSRQVMRRHVKMLEAMNIDPIHRCVLHLGGAYKNKQKAIERFHKQYQLLPEDIQKTIILENDDTTYTAREVLDVCRSLSIPMVLDIHHHRCHHEGENLEELWPEIVKTWEHSPLPVKIHVSSPRNKQNFRDHADLIDPDDIDSFLRFAGEYTNHLDVMVEAKQKDEALFRLVADLSEREGVKQHDRASLFI
ncbi:MAG: UV DNA damage repair endonuclease UvsE [Bacillaceae bacterium]|nr:UV DNA damage repair endonuclease UvsE [Bacillaceae bacterium]